VADVVGAPARLDWAKLGHLNNHYIRLADHARLATLVTDVLRSREVPFAHDGAERLVRTIPLVKEGAKTTLELADLVLFAMKQRPIALEPKAAALFTDEVRGRIERLAAALAQASDWTVTGLADAMKAFADSEGVGLGKFGPALRAILAAGAVAPDLASALFALGREEALARIEEALSQVR